MNPLKVMFSPKLSSGRPSRKRPLPLLRNVSVSSSADGDSSLGRDASTAAAAATEEAEEDEVGEDGGPREKMEIIPLGGGQEVGRSCIVVKYRGKIIMLDCGLHSQKVGHEALPLLDIFDDLPKVDLLLVTHFHIDHMACLPYLTEKTTFKGRIFMTHPTKAVTQLLLQDFVRTKDGDHDPL